MGHPTSCVHEELLGYGLTRQLQLTFDATKQCCLCLLLIVQSLVAFTEAGPLEGAM